MTVHGKDTYVSLGGQDLSAFTNNTEWNESADSHDSTTYGRKRKTYNGGLLDGTVTISGVYDTTESEGPRALIRPFLGEKTTFVYRPEGTGDGLPEDSVEVIVTSYQQTSPVADNVTWTAELQMTGDITSTDQPTGTTGE